MNLFVVTIRFVSTIICGSVLWSSNAAAADWRLVQKTDEATWKVDFATVASTSKGYTKAWMMVTYSEPRSSKGTPVLYRSMKGLDYYNCKERTSFTSQQILFADNDGLGAVLKENSLPVDDSKFTDVSPDSLGELYLETVCGINKGKK